MAIWQYDLMAIPRDELVARVGTISVAVTAEQLSKGFWETRQPHPTFAAEFTKWHREMASWSDKTRMWGTEESNRIDVVYKDGRVVHVKFRVELRSLSMHFIEKVAAFARKSNCVLVSAHSLAVVDPLRQAILLHLCRSPGANSMLDFLSGTESAVTSILKPSIFLSHSSADKVFVSRLATDLKSRGVPVWFDKWELKIGDSLIQKIEEGINNSGWLAVVLSRNSIVSDWVQKELRAAQAKELRDKNVFVLPVVIDDCEIPLFLLDKLYADFRESYDHGLESLYRRVFEGEDAARNSKN